MVDPFGNADLKGKPPLRQLALSRLCPPPSVFPVFGDKPNGAGRAMLAVQFRIPAAGAGLAKPDLVFHADQFSRPVGVIHTAFHCVCFHRCDCGIFIPIINPADGT
jgi:hypothetical protein